MNKYNEIDKEFDEEYKVEAIRFKLVGRQSGVTLNMSDREIRESLKLFIHAKLSEVEEEVIKRIIAQLGSIAYECKKRGMENEFESFIKARNFVESLSNK